MEQKLLELLKYEAQEIKISFDKAKIEGAGTPQEVSDRRENSIVNIFISKYFPFPFRVVKGNIIDSYGSRSSSIDCIIINPSHPYTIDPKNNKASIIFADGVDVAIEVKPDLSNEDELYRALGQVQSVKKLRRKHSEFSISKRTSARTETSLHIPTYIYSEKTFSDVRVLVEKIVKYYIENKVPLHEQFDYIVINNRLMLFNCYVDGYAQLGNNHGILFSETAENTLASFLLWLNRNPKSEMAIRESIILYYINDDIYREKLLTFADLNELKRAADASC